MCSMTGMRHETSHISSKLVIPTLVRLELYNLSIPPKSSDALQKELQLAVCIHKDRRK